MHPQRMMRLFAADDRQAVGPPSDAKLFHHQ
jgi:hypothetical protein